MARVFTSSTDNILPWDVEFMKVDMPMLFDIVLVRTAEMLALKACSD